VVSIQNGLCEMEIAEVVGAERTVGAFVNFGADYLEPGVVHRGNRGAVVVGELDGQRTPRVKAIHHLLEIFEPNAVLTDNIFGYLWGKLAYAALLFATALTDDSIADVLDAGKVRPLMRAIGREVVSVALAQGVTLQGFDGFDPEAFAPAATDARTDASLDDLVTFNRASAKTHSGIWRDLAVRKRVTEVDAQLGPVVRLGRERGVPAPLTAAIIEQIHEIERGERPQVWANLDELELGGMEHP
jgi:2-dehydropantoate 2-reductase